MLNNSQDLINKDQKLKKLKVAGAGHSGRPMVFPFEPATPPKILF